ncbi:flagellar assembly factor FliW [Kineosphaera limosa]|uniref:Flagellar assembly factor FliW n=1 Tax=Kineosphaera limosa NBRC 100340 TaxID=1184609 RepID=K6XHL6_9MICO|nr:flagellar assembly protein FliW [Kineosphaera limosa]NYD99865.1 flagellar assembly factor FliW [Kineosphaera limosa]GAB98299.1 flagellar assembly factor FliW [Kineosphaera limosa NBRC 100340]
MSATTESSKVTQVDLTLPMGLVGFPLAQRFRLTESEGGLYEMDCLDIPDMGFVVVAPSPYFPEYSPIIDPETAARLELESADDALVLLLVNLGSEEEPPGANLLAPVVVNRHTRRAMQVVLIDQELPLRATFPTAR